MNGPLFDLSAGLGGATLGVALPAGLVALAQRAFPSLFPGVGRAQAATAALPPGEPFELTTFEFCPREQRTRPHALAADGSLRCWSCGTETAVPHD